ncbi:MAG: hypothetical protein Q8Q14_04625, partial [Gemmatimonadales bacterium]|nr:hypothetical protein [Gemmatimonadales bacterium]
VVVRAWCTISTRVPVAGSARLTWLSGSGALAIRHPLAGVGMIAVVGTPARAELIDLTREAEEERLLGLDLEVSV